MRRAAIDGASAARAATAVRYAAPDQQSTSIVKPPGASK